MVIKINFVSPRRSIDIRSMDSVDSLNIRLPLLISYPLSDYGTSKTTDNTNSNSKDIHTRLANIEQMSIPPYPDRVP